MRQNPFEVKFLCAPLLTRLPRGQSITTHSAGWLGKVQLAYISCTCRSDVWQDCTGPHLSFWDDFARLESMNMNCTVDTVPCDRPCIRSLCISLCKGSPPPCLHMRLKCWTESNQHIPFLGSLGQASSPNHANLCHLHTAPCKIFRSKPFWCIFLLSTGPESRWASTPLHFIFRQVRDAAKKLSDSPFHWRQKLASLEMGGYAKPHVLS